MGANNYRDHAVDYVTHNDLSITVSNGEKQCLFPLCAVRFDGKTGEQPGLFDGLRRGENILLEVQEWAAQREGLQ